MGGRERIDKVYSSVRPRVLSRITHHLLGRCIHNRAMCYIIVVMCNLKLTETTIKVGSQYDVRLVLRTSYSEPFYVIA